MAISSQHWKPTPKDLRAISVNVPAQNKTRLAIYYASGKKDKGLAKSNRSSTMEAIQSAQRSGGRSSKIASSVRGKMSVPMEGLLVFLSSSNVFLHEE